MKKIYASFLLALASSVSLFAQSPTIAITQPETACLNSIQKIQVALTGVFNADNKFAVQVRKNDNTPVIAELPARLVAGKIEVTHSDSSLSLAPYIQLRVTTTSPKTESNWYNVIIHSKGSVNMSLADSDTINAGEDITIKFTTLSNSTANITLNDGSRFSLSSFQSGYFNTFHSKGVNVTTPFYILHAENTCGPMQVSGQVKAVINPTSLKTVSVSPAAACAGSEIKVAFSTMGPALPASTRYKLRIQVYQGEASKVIEVPAQLKDNWLVATFPKAFHVSSRSNYKVRIITENPAIVGVDSDYSFAIYPTASATITTPSKTIDMGEKTTIGVAFSGIAPFSATLQDGTIVSGNNNTDIAVRPGNTTAYKISNFTSGCGTAASTSGQTMLVTVKPGVAMDPVEGSNAFCAGTTAKVKMLSNVTFNAGSSFTVNAWIGDKIAYSFAAKKVGDYLEFQIPTLPENTDRALSYDKITALNIASRSPDHQSANAFSYIIRSKPEMTVLPHSVFNYKGPSEALFGYELHGTGPFNIEDPAGINHYIEGYSAWNPSFYIHKTQDFIVKSISNACFKNESLPIVRMTLDTAGAAPGLFIQPLKAFSCKQDSIEITFIKTGKFNAGNAFRIEGYSDCCEFQTLATVNKDGTYRVKIPVSVQSRYVNFRVSSTSPSISSEKVETFLQLPPTEFSINPAGTRDAPAEHLAGEEISLWPANSEGGLSSFVYTDGVTEKTQELKPTDYRAVLTQPAGTVVPYTIKSATNTCGTFPVNLTTYIRVLPYRIVVKTGEEGRSLAACVNGNLTVPFVTLDGDASKAKFSLQIAKDKSLAFTDLVSNVSGYTFTVTMPGSVAPGLYQLRVISSEGSVSNVADLLVGTAPTATMTATEPIVLNPGEWFSSKIAFTGSAPWTMIYENSEKQTTNENPYTRNTSTDGGKEFSLISVYNSCGYGPVSGKVAVAVKPTLNAYSQNQEVCAGSSVPVRYQLQGDASLDADYIVFQLVNTKKQEVIGIDSTRIKDGTMALKIPQNLTGDFYQLRSIVRSYDLAFTLPLTIKKKVDVTLLGNTTINAGENAQLQIQSNLPVNEAIQYKLSDGSIGTFYGGNGNAESHVKVSPVKTTTYTIVSADNGCGEGKKSGSATVEVNPSAERTVSVTSWEAFEGSAFCIGEAILVNYTQKGTFSASNKMTVQISDSTGKNFKSVTTTGNASPLKATVPADLSVRKKYRIRVTASDPGTGSGAYEFPLSPGTRATARFASEALLDDTSEIPKIAVLLSGTGPWNYDFGSALDIKTRYAVAETDTIYLSQNSLSEYYKIFRVSNRCGSGTVEKPDIIRVQVILGESTTPEPRVIVAPNPTEDIVTMQFPDASARTITLVNAAGRAMLIKSSSAKEEHFTIRQLPTGIYMLNIEGKNARSVFKILKR